MSDEDRKLSVPEEYGKNLRRFQLYEFILCIKSPSARVE